jgi:cytosine/adenosine deaminase-related metal-dependent hydrolase
MPRVITAAAILDVSGARGPSRITLDGERIAAVEPLADGAPFDDLLVMPALANAHDHARPIRTSSIGGFGRPLETWLHRLRLFAPVDPYLATAASFGRAVLGGQGAAMVHYTGVQGLTDYVTEARDVARAAGDAGLRIAFAVAMRDQNPLVYGDSGPILDALSSEARSEVEQRYLSVPPLPVAAQMERVDVVAEAIGSPMVDVQYGPQGVQWATPALLAAIAEGSARTGRRVHIHLLETKYQRDYADRVFPQGIVRYLKDIGLLSPRLTLAHCTWARPDELDLIAEAGCTISINTSSNLALRSGIAPVAAMLKAGCKVGLGIDGQAFDEDDDIIREMRLVWSLHAGWGFDRDIEPARVLEAVLAAGHWTLNSPVTGRIEPGAPADLLVLDRKALDSDAVMDVEPIELLFARGTAAFLKESVVAGRTVVANGKPTGLDLAALHDELRSRLRTGVAERAALGAVLPELDGVIAGHFRDRLGCC